MSSELFEALNLLEKERGIQVDFMVDKITKAILTACKNSYDNEDARVEVNPDKGAFDVYLRKEVVDEVFEPNKEISLEDAQKIDPNATYEDKVEVQLNTKEFGRIATQNAKNVILQKIREEERKVLYDEYYGKEKEVVTGIVQRVMGKNVSINLGKADSVFGQYDKKLLESVSIPMKFPNKPRFANEVICSIIPVLWSLNHQAEPCCIFPHTPASWKHPINVPIAALSTGFKLYNIVFGRLSSLFNVFKYDDNWSIETLLYIPSNPVSTPNLLNSI